MNLSSLATFLIILGFASSLFLVYYAQKKSNSALAPYYKMKQVKPSKVKYGIASFVYAVPYSILSIVLALLLTKEIVFAFASALITPLYLLTLALATYPYYIVAIYNGKVNGATLSGWKWRRAEININEIDKSKILQPGFGKLFGITVIHSISGAKILTVGLDNMQLAEILEFGKGE